MFIVLNFLLEWVLNFFLRKKEKQIIKFRALPIGGYVAMAGEADQEDNELMKDVPYERTLKGIKTWKKMHLLC